MYHDSEFYGHSGVLRTPALIKRDYVRSSLQHYVERYILSCDVCQVAKPQHVNNAMQPSPLPAPETKWHSVSVHWASGLPPTTRGDDAIMSLVDQFFASVECSSLVARTCQRIISSTCSCAK